MDPFKELKRECNRCGHKWTKRQVTEPIRCPGCGNKYWNKPRKNKPGAGRPPVWK